MAAYRIYDFKDETEWLKGRMNGIGGSDASAIVGMNPYKSNIELFEEKTGRREALRGLWETSRSTNPRVVQAGLP